MPDSQKEGKQKSRRPATTPEGRENQLIALAVDLAEQQLAKGTASSQVISHYLKLGSTKEVLEKQILEKKRELLQAQTDAIKSAKKIEELYKTALDAMRTYSGKDEVEDDD
jgi:DNA-binding ferritin-like protein